MTTNLTTSSFRAEKITGALMPWIGSPAPTMPSYQDLTLGFFQPGSEAVDAFCQDWRFNNNWLCPPVCLIARFIQHLELCHARETLIAPLWKSSFFWNSCSKDAVHWSSFVTDWVYLPNFQELFIKGKARNSLFGSRSFNFDVVELRIDFSHPRLPRISHCLLANVAHVLNLYSLVAITDSPVFHNYHF